MRVGGSEQGTASLLFFTEGLRHFHRATRDLFSARAPLASRNLQRGRGDRRGAFRLAGFGFLVAALSEILRGHHVLAVDEAADILGGLSLSFLFEVFLWSKVRPGSVVVAEKASQGSSQVVLVEDHHVVQAFPPDGTDDV